MNADSRQFPDDWLFRWRWSKGKKQAKGKKKKDDEAGGSDAEGEGGDLKPKGLDFLALVSPPRPFFLLHAMSDTGDSPMEIRRP